MGRLIDADKLKQHYAWWENGSAEMTLDRAKQIFDTIIDVQPTVDAERHGHWIHRFGDGHIEQALLGGKCSICGFVGTATNYCPNCGAKMDEVEDAETN